MKTPQAIDGSNPIVAFDARWTETGLGAYSSGLLSRVKRYGDFKLRGLTFVESVSAVGPFCDEIATVTAKMYSLSEQIQIPWAARGALLLHVPHYNAPVFYPGNMVVTIHDLTHILDETYRRMPSSRFAAGLMKLVSRRSAHIITGSEYSKAKIVEHLHAREEKITVIPHGVGAQFVPHNAANARLEINKTLGFEGPYVLYIGNLKPHKNVSGLIKAFALFDRDRNAGLTLLIVGEDPVFGPRLREEVEQLKLEARVRFVPRVLQSIVPLLYAGADLTVLPSFQEGFGLPVIESMACGTPVACSSASSVPEAGGRAAEYFDPLKPEDIARAMANVLGSSQRAEELKLLGLERAAKFTWDRSAERHVEVYRRFL